MIRDIFPPVPPDILSSGTSDGEVSVLEGENATLSCKASGRPPPRVFWRREKSDFILMRGGHDPLIQGKISRLSGIVTSSKPHNRRLFITTRSREIRVCFGTKCLSARKTTTRMNYSRPYLRRVTYYIFSAGLCSINHRMKFLFKI